MRLWISGTGYFFGQGDRQLFAKQKSNQSPKKLPVPVRKNRPFTSFKVTLSGPEQKRFFVWF
jgi:hypothetical protein